MVRRKAAWLVRRITRAKAHGPPLSPREFVSGESVLYLGRHYRLKVHPHETGEALLHEYPLRVGRRGPHFSGPSAGATLQG